MKQTMKQRATSPSARHSSSVLFALRCTLSAGLILLAAGTSASAQGAQCEECELLVETWFIAGDLDGPGALAYPQGLALDSSGRLLVSSWQIPGEIMVFDTTGAYQRSVGRRGSGPGEYLGVMHIVVRGDEIHIFDGPARRRTILSNDFEVLGTSILPGTLQSGAAVLEDGATIINAHISDRQRIGLPLHSVDSGGEILFSFGADSVGNLPGVPFVGQRLVAASSRGEYVTAYQNQYLVQFWSKDGRLVRELRRSPELFEPYWQSIPTSDRRPPQPRLGSIYEDSAGNIWVTVAVPDRGWREVLEPIGRAGRGPTHRWSDDNAYFDTIIDVLRPNGSLIASARIDPLVHRILGDGVLATYDDSSGVPQMVILRALLQQQEDK